MSVHENWLQSLKDFANETKLQLPPPSMLELQLEFLEVEPKVRMRARLPFQKRFTNPVGLYQGGFMSAAMDDVFGPLSYISAGRPCVTLSMNTTYLKPFHEKLQNVFIDARVVQMTKNFIFMRADMTDEKGNLIAHAETHVNILNDDLMARVNL